ncbi:hypothetical protein IFM89_025207, partial [Coptis chinensis]
MELDSCDCLSMAFTRNFIITFIVITIISILIRIVYVISQSSKPLKRLANEPMSTLIVLGSGGHTAEVLNVLSELQKDRFVPRIYVAINNMSFKSSGIGENWLAVQANGDKVSKPAQFIQIYRSREVGQSYLTSIGTTLIAIGHALLLMIKIRPQVILCNGPGTCIPLCIIAFLFKVVGIRWSSIFYVESIARVRRLSLSGLLLYKLRMADQFFVQWPQLEKKYPRAHYVGCLMRLNESSHWFNSGIFLRQNSELKLNVVGDGELSPTQDWLKFLSALVSTVEWLAKYVRRINRPALVSGRASEKLELSDGCSSRRSIGRDGRGRRSLQVKE